MKRDAVLLFAFIFIVHLTLARSSTADPVAACLVVSGGVGLIVKSLLEAGMIYADYDQFQEIDDVKAKIKSSNESCEQGCMDDLSKIDFRMSRAKVGDGFGMGMNGLAIVANVVVLTAMMTESSVSAFLIGNGIVSMANFFTTLTTNALIWDADIRYSTDIPPDIFDSLKSAEYKGIFPMLTTSILGGLSVPMILITLRNIANARSTASAV